MTENQAEQLRTAAAAMGLNEETVELLRLLPMVYVAWADGEIQAEEIAIIAEEATELGIAHPESLVLLKSWLDKRPEPEFFQKGLRLMSYLLATLPEQDVSQASTDISELCKAVARASGGLLGHSVRIEPKEMLAIRQISTRLSLSSREAAQKSLAQILDHT